MVSPTVLRRSLVISGTVRWSILRRSFSRNISIQLLQYIEGNIRGSRVSTRPIEQYIHTWYTCFSSNTFYLKYNTLVFWAARGLNGFILRLPPLHALAFCRALGQALSSQLADFLSEHAYSSTGAFRDGNYCRYPKHKHTPSTSFQYIRRVLVVQ